MFQFFEAWNFIDHLWNCRIIYYPNTALNASTKFEIMNLNKFFDQLNQVLIFSLIIFLNIFSIEKRIWFLIRFKNIQDF